MPHVRQRGDDHSRTLPYHAPPRPKVVLPRLRVQPYAQGVSQPPVVQPLRGTPGHGGTPAFAVPADMRIGEMHGNIHYRLHPVGVMPHKACPQPQDDEGMGGQGQVHDGMVLRVQAAYSDKRPWRDNPMDAHAGERGRPGAIEGQGLHAKALRKDIRRQGIHKPGTFRKSLH